MMKMHCRNVTFLVCDVSPHTTEVSGSAWMMFVEVS